MRSSWILLLAAGIQTGAGQSAKPPATAGASVLKSGIEARQRGDLNTAIAEFRKELAAHPENLEARIDLGEALTAAGQPDAAIEEERRALEIAPGNVQAHLNLGSAYYRKGDFSHARSEFETVHTALPSDLKAAILLGYAYNKMDRPLEAVDLLSAFEAGNESNNELEYALAYALIQTGRVDEGVTRLEKVAAATHSADAWLLAGATRLNREKMSEARTDLDAALKLNPSIPGLYTMDAQAHYAMGEADKAVQGYQAALKANPLDFAANLDLGNILLDKGDLEGAKPMLELAFQLQPDFPRARLEMAKVKELSGNYAEAATMLEGLAKTEPNWLAPHWELSSVYFKLNRTDDGKREREIVKKLQVEQRDKDSQK
jgi:tetratricopeptide (TPR) repeat protein